MILEENDRLKKTGEMLGFLVAYLVFTTVAYFVFSFFGKFPENWKIMHMVPFTLSTVLAGHLIMRALDR